MRVVAHMRRLMTKTPVTSRSHMLRRRFCGYTPRLAPSHFPDMKRVSVRQSPIHGKGVFALRALSAGERIFEYRGLVTTWREATRAYARRTDAAHTFLFGLSDGRVIDGGRGGNGARWLNHACKANCEAIEKSGRVYINALKDIQPGAELFIDYALEVSAKARVSASAYACRCGARRCRGTMLAPI